MAAPAPSAAGPAAPDPTFAALMAARPHLSLRAGVLHVEDVPLPRIAEAVGTPAYVYAGATMQARFRAFRAALAAEGIEALVCYAMKANDNLAVVAGFARLGAGADVVSEGELHRALAAGIPAGRIIFSGVGKTESELRLALALGLRQINVESAEELAMLAALARALGQRARVALRLNPDIDAGTHAKITTGRAENKFGIPMSDAPALFDRYRDDPGVELVGLALHIGSQIIDLTPYRDAFARLAGLVGALRAAGHRVAALDLGGGLGIPYRSEPAPDPAAYAAIVRQTVGGLGCHLAFEPGRWMVGPAGLLLARVILEKQGAGRRFVILDAAMNDLIRPSLYDAWHGILPVAAEQHEGALAPADVVGPVCESGDPFARARLLPACASGALLAILDAGAYGAVMASRYNARPEAPEVLVHGESFAVIRPRPTHAEMLAHDRLPPWLTPAAEAPAEPAAVPSAVPSAPATG